MQIFAIAAMDEGRVIGFKNSLPWDIPEDRKLFAELTTGHTVVMGRKTYLSLPARYRPLPNRQNIVVTRDAKELQVADGVWIWEDLAKGLEEVCSGEIKLPTDKLWIVGGEEIYKQSLEYWDGIYLTIVQGKRPGDAYLPEFEDKFQLVSRKDSRSGDQAYSFCYYTRMRP